VSERNNKVHNMDLVKQIWIQISRSKGTVLLEKVKAHEEAVHFPDSIQFGFRVKGNDKADSAAKTAAEGPWTDDAEDPGEQPWAITLGWGTIIEIRQLKQHLRKVFQAELIQELAVEPKGTLPGRGHYNNALRAIGASSHERMIRVLDRHSAWKKLELHHKMLVDMIKSNTWTAEHSSKKERPTPWKHLCCLCSTRYARKIRDTKSHTLLGNCVLTRKLFTSRYPAMRAILTASRVPAPTTENIIRQLITWTDEASDESLSTQQQHALFFKGTHWLDDKSALQIEDILREGTHISRRRAQFITDRIIWAAMVSTHNCFCNLGERSL